MDSNHKKLKNFGLIFRHLFPYFCLIFCLNLLLSFAQAVENYGSLNPKKNMKTATAVFKESFIQIRIHQIDVIQSVLKFQNYEKQYKITNKALEKIYEVISSSKVIVENSDYIPGLELPSNLTVSEALGKIVDNTAMFGEFQLKLPDITGRIMKNHPDWAVLMKWAIGFSNSTGVFDDKTIKMINLLCQEMNLIPREDNFVNPYRKYDIKVEKQSSTISPKQKKIKIKKGPRMSKVKNSEL